MRYPHTSRLALISVLAVSLACASGGAATTSGRQDSSLITRAQITQYQYRNAFDAVQALHANWLTVKGTDSFRNPSQIWVYLNETRMGGVEVLRDIAAPTIASIKHYDGIAASAKWGLDHGQGVVQVWTH